MIFSRLTKPCVCGVLALGAVCLFIDEAIAQVVAPSTWTTDIQVQGEDPGTEFDDWAASGIPISVTDPADNPGLWDINTIQIANDDTFIYLRVTYHSNLSVGTFLAFDLDQDINTGFDVLETGLIGSELGYLNDFAFEQETGVFNNQDPLVGGPIGNGGALIWPIFNVNSPQKEYAIPLDAMFTNDETDPGSSVQTPAFPTDTFDLMVFHDLGLGDITEVITYTLATAPSVPGDFDGDLDVDGADFLEWQREFGSTLDASDLTDWQTNYGNGALASLSAVPEPASLLLACFGLTTLALRRRRA